MTILLDGSNPLILYITGNNARENAAQVRGKQIRLLILVQCKIANVFMCRNEWLLKFRVDFQQPVEIVCVIRSFTELSHLFYPGLHFLGDAYRIIDDDLVTVLRLWAQRVTDKLIDLAEKALCSS